MAENNILNTFTTDITKMLSRREAIPSERKTKEEELKGVTERGAEEVRGIQQMYGRGLEEEQRKYATGAQEAQRLAGESMRDVAFTPTQENTKDLTQLFGMLTAAAFLTGGKGRQSGMGALAAMTGAMEGYRKGQKEVFDRELKEFDKRIREVQAHNQNVRNKLSDTLNTLKIDRDAGLAKLKSLEFEIQGSQAALAFRRGDIQRGITYLNEENKAITQAISKAAEMQQRGQIAERNRQEQERRHRENMAQRAALAKEKQGKLSAQQQSFEDMVSISINEAAAQVENLATMSFATTGFWQGRNTKGLLDAPIGALANKLTTEDVQRYNAVIGIIGREAAKVFAGGRIITDKAASDFANQFTVREGDKPFTVLEKLANIRQFFERAIEVKQARPDVSPGMKNIYINALNSFKESIPITNKEVNAAKREYDQTKGKSKKTFGDIMSGMKTNNVESVIVNGKTYQRPVNFTDQQWNDYKQSVGSSK